MSILHKEELIVLNKENFNRIKKNLSKHLHVSQNEISECFAKSIGFENLNHANNKNFKTNKFINPHSHKKIQQDYPELKMIFQSQSEKKRSVENVLLYRRPMIAKTDDVKIMDEYMREIRSEVFEKQLSSHSLIFANLVQCLNVELQYGIVFNLEKWFLMLDQLGFFRELYIGFHIKDFFYNILEDFDKNELASQKQCFIGHLETLFLSENEKLEQTLFKVMFDLPDDIIMKIIKNVIISKKYTLIEKIVQFCFYGNSELSGIKIKILEIIQTNTDLDLTLISKDVSPYDLVNHFFNSSLKTNDIIRKITSLSQFVDLLSLDKKMMVINLLSEKISEEYSHFLLIDEIKLFFNKHTI